MRSRGGVVAVGLAAGVLIALLPVGAAPLVALGAAVLAGALLPASPMVAALLVLAPTLVLAVLRTAVGSDRDVGAMVLALVTAGFVTAIVTHVSAGVVTRREHS